MDVVDAFTAEPAELCPVCGEAVKMRVTRPGSEAIVNALCRCRQSEMDEERLARKAATDAETERRRYAMAFGSREVQGSFEQDDGRSPHLMDACSAYAEMFDGIRGQKVNGMLLYGPTRKGKTFAAEAVAMKLHQSGRSVFMDTAAGFVQRIQSAGRGELDALMLRIAKCDLLVLDDFGASRDTSFGHEAVFSVIDTRVSAKGPMIVTTNLSLEELSSAGMDERRASFRIMERCLAVEVDPDVAFTGNADHGKLASMIF